MSLLSGPWDTKPDAVNEMGVKWWLDKDTTRYAIAAASVKKVKTDIRVFFVETPEGERTRLIIQDGQPVSDCQSLEGIGAKIDMLLIAGDMPGKKSKRMGPKSLTGKRG